jgi:DNA adenine methylase
MTMATPKFLRPAVKTHGGKRYLARRIVARLPPHRVYVEPFAGGLSVLLNKPPAEVEVANDRNAALMAFYGVLRDRPGELLDRLAGHAYDRPTFAWSQAEGEAGDEVDAAARFLARNRMSRGGLGRDFAWSERLRGGRPGDLNAWETIKAELPRIAARLARVELRCRDALEVIREFDGPDTLFYLDPPYLPETRTALGTYAHEMGRADHVRLLEAIVRCRGMVAISGYPSPLYDDALRGWKRVPFDMACHAGQGRSKGRRVEVLWLRGVGPEPPITGPRPDHVTDGVEVFIHRLESTASECRRADAFWRDVIARALVRRRGEERKKAERN